MENKEIINQLRNSFFDKAKWPITIWFLYLYIFSIYFDHPNPQMKFYLIGLFIIVQMGILFLANRILHRCHSIIPVITLQIIIIICTIISIDRTIANTSLLVGTLPIISIEEYTFLDKKGIIRPITLGCSIGIIIYGIINNVNLFSTILLIEAILFVLVFSHYYYRMLYDKNLKELELTQLNYQIKQAYNDVARLTSQRMKQEIAQDLHDTTTQDLIGINLYLSNIHNKLNKNELESTRQSVEKLQIFVKEAIASSRQMIKAYRNYNDKDSDFNLSDRVLEDAQLLRVRYGLITDINIDSKINLDGSTYVDVVRMINEALINVVKHANIDRAEVSAELINHKLSIRIINHGDLIPETHKSKQDHYGLIGMRERAQAHHGDMKIISTKETGTIILIELNLGGNSNVSNFYR